MEQNTFEITELRTTLNGRTAPPGGFMKNWKVPREKYRDSINECIAQADRSPPVVHSPE